MIDVSTIKYPEELPVSNYRDAIIAALRQHDVIIVSGDTGSGKTTQLPKIALELGRGVRGKIIAVTQPRRLATIAMATRVAEELGVKTGEEVGYQHRYATLAGDNTQIKFATDGILLAETRCDRLLTAYDTIIVDEAHERSLNIDFLLGILKRILRKRKDLKVIISSATLDVKRFSVFFDNAPVIEIPGKLFPVAIEYMATDEDEGDLPRQVGEALTRIPPRDDTLVFLPGEREIRECAEYIEGRFGKTANETIPLLASLPQSEQKRAFTLSNRRRVILSTNVAETSLTIPGIKAVIDSGLARISRYIHRTGVQRLQIEKISQASARQRAGRCGRIAPGICIRLYSEEDFKTREEFTSPEILRSSLAGTILTMLDLHLGDIARFPFIEPPRNAMIHEGFRELLELGAIARDQEQRPILTDDGKRMARMPIEPRLAKMLLEGSRNAVLPRLIPVVAALSCDDPKRRPAEERAKADALHARFKVAGSDFLGLLKFWDWWHDSTAAMSQSKARNLAKANFISFVKMREWAELSRQLFKMCEQIRLDTKSDNGDDAAFHRALLSGLLSRIGKYDQEENNYKGAYAIRFSIHPSSGVDKRQRQKEVIDRNIVNAHKKERKSEPAHPEWIACAELVDTSKLYARNAMIIDPSWLEPLSKHIAKHSYTNPSWDGRSGFARVLEQVTLYGLTIVSGRRRDLTPINPPLARELFIRFGIIEGEFPNPPRPIREDISLIDEMRRMAQSRRRSELFPISRLEEYFEERLPRKIANCEECRRYLKNATPQERDKLSLKRQEWLKECDGDERDFPGKIVLSGKSFALEYNHSPANPNADGMTCIASREDVDAILAWNDDWLVPGMLNEKLAWMIATLPSALRKILQPVDEIIARILSLLKPGAEPLEQSFRAAINKEFALTIKEDAWKDKTIPNHLRAIFRIVDTNSHKTIIETRDKNEIRKKLGIGVRREKPTNETSTAWNFGKIAPFVIHDEGGWKTTRYPGLLDCRTGVKLFYSKTEENRDVAHINGLCRLYSIELGRKLRQNLHSRDLSLEANRLLKELDWNTEDLSDDIFRGAIKHALLEEQAPIFTPEEYKSRFEEKKSELIAANRELIQRCAAILSNAKRLCDEAETNWKLCAETRNDIQTQLAWLVYKGFPAHVSFDILKRYDRYFKAISKRIERAANSPSADKERIELVSRHWEKYLQLLKANDKSNISLKKLSILRWAIEDYRISLFAQELKTFETVSEKRLQKLYDEASHARV